MTQTTVQVSTPCRQRALSHGGRLAEQRGRESCGGSHSLSGRPGGGGLLGEPMLACMLPCHQQTLAAEHVQVAIPIVRVAETSSPGRSRRLGATASTDG